MVKVLVTGASGFVGGQVVKQLATMQHIKVLATGRRNCPDEIKQLGIEYIPIDLNMLDQNWSCDICIHCAGLAEDTSSFEELTEHNVHGTENLIRHLENCIMFLYISSASVYNFKKFSIAREVDAVLTPDISDYGRTKLKAEEIVRESGINSIYILRPRAIYGLGDQKLYPRIMSRLKKGYFIVPGNLSVSNSLTHIDNLVECIKLCIQNKEQGVKIYNVADARNYNLRNVFRALGEKESTNVKFLSIPIPLVHGLVRLAAFFNISIALTKQSIDYVTLPSELDIAKIRKELRPKLQYDLDDFLME